METIPQGPGTKPSCGPGIVGTLIAVIIAFLAGIVVGLHPTWIPINVRGAAAEPDFSQPSMSAMPGVQTDRDAHGPPPAATEPATTEPAAQ